MREKTHRGPVLVKAEGRGAALSAFTPEQREQLAEYLAAQDAARRQNLRDLAQGLGAVVAALRRLGGMN
jgi:hypothetical protein